MKPRIGITTGCRRGIGPEIVGKAIYDKRVLDICEPVVFGGSDEKRPCSPEICGAASIKAVEDAVKAAMSGEVSAIVTAPINKLHWKAADSKFSGHTELLAHLTGAKRVAMMMFSPRLKITLATTHVPLSEVPRAITEEKIIGVARLANDWLRNARIAVCSLNPHASDKIGSEEDEIIAPAIAKLQSEGICASGPFSADTIFRRAMRGEFDIVLAMYHDQALPVIKTLDFENTVNVTLGLPFVRTSPGHGTAEDIAGKGVAGHEGMVAAIEMAVNISRTPLKMSSRRKSGSRTY